MTWFIKKGGNEEHLCAIEMILRSVVREDYAFLGAPLFTAEETVRKAKGMSEEEFASD